MPAYQNCTGAVHAYVAFNNSNGYVLVPPSSGAAYYIGTCEQYPLVQGTQAWEPTFNDLRGPRPFDKQFYEEDKVLVLDLNKFDEDVIEMISSFGNGSQSGIGIYKNLTANLSDSFTIWLAFSNFGIPSLPFTTLPAGEVYFNCNLAQVDYDPIGTRSRKTRLVIEADPAYYINAPANLIPGPAYATYSINAAFFAGLPTPL